MAMLFLTLIRSLKKFEKLSASIFLEKRNDAAFCIFTAAKNGSNELASEFQKTDISEF